MRESFGGAFMIKLVLIFIVVYISFMAVAINYAKAFRVKNGVINILEQYKYDGSKNKEDPVIKKVDDYLRKVPYNHGSNVKENEHCSVQGDSAVFTKYGACLVKVSGDDSPRYFKVITYISIDFPFFNISMTIPISGETKSIY